MSAAILAEALARQGVAVSGSLTQYVRSDGVFTPVERPVGAASRPPMREVTEYAARRARAS
jgi:hypothetical protein